MKYTTNNKSIVKKRLEIGWMLVAELGGSRKLGEFLEKNKYFHVDC